MLQLAMVNWVGVVAAAIAAYVLGMIWYSPKVFGEAWMKELKLSKSMMNKMKGSMGKTYLFAFIAALVTSYVFAQVIQLAGVTTYSDAITLGVWLWLGFIATVLLGGLFWEGRSMRFYTVTASYQLISMIAMALVLVALP